MKKLGFIVLSAFAAIAASFSKAASSMGDYLGTRLFGYMAQCGLLMQVAPTTINTMSGALMDISAALPATYDAAGYTAVGMVYTAIGEVENFGAHGLKANIIKFTSVGTAVVEKAKGSKDYGSASYTIANIPSDVGLVILAAASESQNRYSMKLTYPLGTGTTSEIHYFDVLVSEYQYSDGTVDTVQKLAVMIEICRKPVIVAAT